MKKLPRITVITPVFNGEKYIKETIDSVLSLSKGFSVEYLIVDDGSTDETPEIVRGYGDLITVISQPNGGESSAVNRGLEKAVGEFVLIVSADDPLLTSEIFFGVEQFFDSNPSTAAWYPDWQIIDEEGNLIEIIDVEEFSEESLIGRSLCLPGPGTFIRKSSALQIHGRQEKWRFVGDFDFWLRLSRVGEIRKRSGVLAQWRRHPESTSILRRGKSMAIERIDVVKEFLLLYSVSNPLKSNALSYAYYSAARLSFYSKEIPARRYLLKSVLERKGFVNGSQLRVFIFVAFLPFSRLGFKIASRVFSRVNRYVR